MMRSLAMVQAERFRQETKGYDSFHDDKHNDGSMLTFAFLILGDLAPDIRSGWPAEWAEKVRSKYDRGSVDNYRRRLVVAAAMICAEIDRFDRELGIVERHDTAAQSYMLDVAMFHHKFGIDQPTVATQMHPDLADFRIGAMREEVDEYEEAYRRGDLEGQLDALGDMIYFAVGTALCSGFDLDEAWRRIQMKNMQKERALPDGSNSKRFSRFDVVKPEGWTPPRHDDLVSPDHVAPIQQIMASLEPLPEPTP